MQVKEIEYPIPGVRKFYVRFCGKDYTCYRGAFRSSTVFTGLATKESTNHTNITSSDLGRKILRACY